MMKLSEILKEKTAHAHGQAEKDLPFFKVEFSSVDYANLIQRMLSLYDPLEKKLFEILRHEPHLELETRLTKASWLKADLKELNQTVSSTPELSPEIANVWQALGVLYVIEGSSLGGQIIAKNFVSRLGLSDSQIHFFKGYGSQTGVMWQRFKGFIDSQDLTAPQVEQVIDGANRAFVFVTAAMRPNLN